MNEPALVAVERHFKSLGSRGLELIEGFCARLATKGDWFVPPSRDQKKQLLACLVLVIRNLRRPSALHAALLALQAHHPVATELISRRTPVRDAWIETLRLEATVWTDQLEEAWKSVTDHVADLLTEASCRPSHIAV